MTWVRSVTVRTAMRLARQPDLEVAAEGTLVPIAFVAVTRAVRATPFDTSNAAAWASPGTSSVSPVLNVTVYVETGLPPSVAGAVCGGVAAGYLPADVLGIVIGSALVAFGIDLLRPRHGAVPPPRATPDVRAAVARRRGLLHTDRRQGALRRHAGRRPQGVGRLLRAAVADLAQSLGDE